MRTVMLWCCAQTWAATGPYEHAVADRVSALTPPRGSAPICDQIPQAGLASMPDDGVLWTVIDAGRTYAQDVLLDTIAYAARATHRALPGLAPLVVGDMSRPKGGPFPPHSRHRFGLDADVGLWWVGGHQPWPWRPVPVDQLDREATLRFVRHLGESGRIERILLDASLIRALEAGGPVGVGSVRLVGTADSPGLLQPAAGHRDHLHVTARCLSPNTVPAQSR